MIWTKDSDAKLDRLAYTITEIVDDCSLDEAFGALQVALAIQISQACPEHREEMARDLRDHVSAILATANHFAVEPRAEIKHRH